jgi:hypothetical protein
VKLTEQLMKLRKHRDALEAFIKGPAHAGYVSARQEELRVVERTILDIDPMRREDEIEQYKLRGEKRCLESLIEVFPNALLELKEMIDDLEGEDLSEANARPRKQEPVTKYPDLN